MKRAIAIITITILVADSVALALVPQTARADVAGTTKSAVSSFTGCFVGNVAGQALSGLAGKLDQKFNDKLNQAENYATTQMTNGLKNLANKLGGHFVTSAAGAASAATGLGSVPVNVQNLSDVNDYFGQNFTNYMNTTNRNDILTRCTAWAILQTISNNTLNIIRTSGPDGGTSFVANWRNFQLGAQYRGENVARAELSTSQLCNYLSNDVKQNYGLNPNQKTNLPPTTDTRTDSLQPFSLQTHCTLPNNFSLQNYQQDFAGNGGWNAYDQLLDPQNNAYGLAFMVQDEFQNQRDIEQSSALNEVAANNGYTGISKCLKKDSNNNCIAYANIKTPGSYLFQNVGQTVAAQFNWLTSAQGLSTILGNATTVLMNRLLNLGNGNDGNFTDAESYNYTPPSSSDYPTPGSGYTGTSSTGGTSSGTDTVSSHNYTQAQWQDIINNAAVGVDPESSTALSTVVSNLQSQGYSTSIITNNGKPSDHKVWLEGAAWTFISSDNYQPGTFRWDPYQQVPAITPYNSCGIPLSDPTASSCTTSSTSSSGSTSTSGSSNTSSSSTSTSSGGTTSSGGGSTF